MSDKVFDLHNDFPTRICSSGDREAVYAAYRTQARRVTSVFFTTYMLNPLSYIAEYTGRYPVTEGRVYAVEDLGFIRSEDDADALAAFPILYGGITWNGENRLSGGAGSDKGLTALGKTVVKALARHKIAVDTAHLSEPGFYDAVESAGVVINSHTCLKSICGHPRNLSDGQIELILSRGGIVGLTLVAQFMGKPEAQGERSDYVRQIDTYAQKFGVRGLCIGTDFNGTDPVAGLAEYNDFVNLTGDLKKIGFKQADIDRIYYKNAEAFFMRREPLPNA